jgi:hypothetical protein
LVTAPAVESAAPPAPKHEGNNNERGGRKRGDTQEKTVTASSSWEKNKYGQNGEQC